MSINLASKIGFLQVKWSPTAALKSKSFTVIEPGKTAEFKHPLGGVYNFTTGGVSVYEVSPTNGSVTFTHVTPSGELVSLRADVSGVHSVNLKGKLVPTEYVGASAKPPSLNKREHNFVSCSSDQQSDLETAAVDAQTYADGAFTYLDGISDSTTCVARSLDYSI